MKPKNHKPSQADIVTALFITALLIIIAAFCSTLAIVYLLNQLHEALN